MPIEDGNPAHLQEDEVVAYLGHQLEGERLAQVELHLAACPACRAEVVEASEILGQRRGRWWPGIPGLITAAAAAGLLAAVLLPRDPTPDAVRSLGGLTQAPVYLGVAVRQRASQSDSLFDVGMAAYAAGEFATAGAELRRALAAGADSVPVQFFLGASLLMVDRPTDAAEAFRGVIAGGATPYRSEARYYLAKALLRLGKVDEAERELRAAAADSSVISGAARALADSVGAAATR